MFDPVRFCSLGQIPQEFVFDAAGVILDPDLLKLANLLTRRKLGRSGRSRSLVFSQARPVPLAVPLTVPFSVPLAVPHAVPLAVLLAPPRSHRR